MWKLDRFTNIYQSEAFFNNLIKTSSIGSIGTDSLFEIIFFI